MKRLLQINPVLRTLSSTGRIVREIGEIAMKNGWESHIAYSRGRDGVMQCTSEVIPVGGMWSVAWHGVMTRLADRHGLASGPATRELVRKIETLAPDVIHIHNIHGYFLDYRVLFRFLSQSGIPVVWTVHDCWMYTGHCYHYMAAGCGRWKTGCGHCPQKREFPASLLADRSRRNWEDKRKAFTSMPKGNLVIVPVSEWMRDEMKFSFLKEYEFRVIRNGIDTETFDICDGSGVRRRYGLEGKHVMLGAASVWSREKGLQDFVRMAECLHDDEVIVLVGLSERQMSGLPDRIVGIRRTDNVRSLAALYSAADLFANPTLQDNYPTVNMESIACGTPVATYRTGGSAEAVTPATGFVVPPGDTDGLLRAFRTVRERGKVAYVEACRRHALENFRKEDRYAEYIRLYDEILQEKQ